MIHSTVGQPVTGADFFDREAEQRHLWSLFHTDNALLLAPRRVGKTSLMRKISDDAARHGIEAAYCTVEGAKSEEDFVGKLYAAVESLPSAAEVRARLRKGALKRAFGKIKKVEVANVFGVELDKLPVPPEQRWELLGNALFDALFDDDRRRLLLVDEVPIFVLALLRPDPTGSRARHFLSWLREQRQRPAGDGWLRWLLAGSVGLDTVAARHRLGDTINDLAIFRLGAFDRETAERLLQRLSNTYSLPLTAAVRNRLLDRIGWLIPYYVQLAFRELKDGGTFGPDSPPGEDDVDQVFETLLSPSRKAYFDYWRQRLTEELGQPDAGAALDLLNACAQDPDGASKETLTQIMATKAQATDSRDEKLRYLLDVLETDGYLIEHERRYRFRSALLREYWLRRVLP